MHTGLYNLINILNANSSMLGKHNFSTTQFKHCTQCQLGYIKRVKTFPLLLKDVMMTVPKSCETSAVYM